MSYLETRVARKIPTTKGELIDKSGASVKVRFSLTQYQKYVEGIPTLRSADGTLQFKDQNEAWTAMDGELRTLKGGGIQANVYVDTVGSFRVTGPVNEI